MGMEDQAETVATIATRFVERMSSSNPPGVQTGFADLDNLLTGLRPGQLIVVAADPSVGKTAFAIGSLAINVARSGIAVLIYTLQQPQDELFDRLVTGQAKLSANRLHSGNATAAEIQDAVSAAEFIGGLPILIDATIPRTVGQIAAQTNLRLRRDPIGLVIIDCLQLISAEDNRTDRELQFDGIVRDLKALAINLEIPLVATAQLDRSMEMRLTRGPRLSDLRHIDAVEQHADVVMLLDRPGTYNEDADTAEARLIIAKHRNGRTGDVPLHWDGTRMAFTNAIKQYPSSFG